MRPAQIGQQARAKREPLEGDQVGGAGKARLEGAEEQFTEVGQGTAGDGDFDLGDGPHRGSEGPWAGGNQERRRKSGSLHTLHSKEGAGSVGEAAGILDGVRVQEAGQKEGSGRMGVPAGMEEDAISEGGLAGDGIGHDLQLPGVDAGVAIECHVSRFKQDPGSENGLHDSEGGHARSVARRGGGTAWVKPKTRWQRCDSQEGCC